METINDKLLSEINERVRKLKLGWQSKRKPVPESLQPLDSPDHPIGSSPGESKLEPGAIGEAKLNEPGKEKPKSGDDTDDTQDRLNASNLTQGAFLISRSIDRSEVWLKHPIYLKAWIWILKMANFQEKKRGNFVYQRGEFFTSYGEIRESLRSYKKHKKVMPSIQQTRDIIGWFAEEGMIEKTPVKRPPNLTLTSPLPHRPAQKIGSQKTEVRNAKGIDERTGVGTYLGLKIRVVNFDVYQSLNNYKNRGRNRDGNDPKNEEKNRPPERARNRGGTEEEHNTKNEKNEKNIKIGSSGKKTPDPRVKEFLGWWGNLFLQETGQPYVFSYDKEGDLTRRLLRVHDLPTLQDATSRFFRDEQCKRRGLTIGIFFREINRLLSSKAMDPLEQAKRELRSRGSDKGWGDRNRACDDP
jgi:hypothetical protein